MSLHLKYNFPRSPFAAAIILLLNILILCSKADAQNLAPNPGFESHTGLPSNYSQWYKCDLWNNASGSATPDYFHDMGTGNANIPFTYLGTVYAHTDDAVMGFFTYEVGITYREYIEATLTEPMVIGQKYHISFWITNGEGDYYCQGASDHVGLRFSVGALSQAIYAPIGGTPQYEYPDVLWTTEWQQLEFDFVADNIYDHVTFGNFRSDAATTYETMAVGDLGGAYYFIDDVSIIPVPSDTILINASICENDFYTMPDGTVVSETTTDTTTLINAAGTDSVIITNLFVVPIENTILDISLCSGEFYTLPGGEIVNLTGEYIDTLLSALGCDSIITTNIIVHPVFNILNDTSICSDEIYILPDGTGTNISGTYVFNFTTIYGCDSIITINLTVHLSYLTLNTVEICSDASYILPDGSVVTDAGIYPVLFTSINGCDSNIVTNLIVHPVYNIISSAVICSGDIYILPDGTSANVSGTYVSNLNSIYGCDSLITTNLTVATASETEQTAFICHGTEYVLPDGVSVEIAGDYITVLPSISGCDSTITTHLIVYPSTDINFTLPEQICLEANPVELIATPEGGIFSGEGVSGNIFDPGISGTGIFNLNYLFTDNNGCENQSSSEIAVTANFADAGEDITIGVNEITNLNGIAGGDYLWIPPTGLSCTDCPNPEVTISGTQTFSLLSTDANGCSAIDSVTVFVGYPGQTDIFVPNTFTPNGDGMNDNLFAFGPNLVMIEEMIVYNRWGELIFHAENLLPGDTSHGWDGLYDGEKTNEGVYVYILNVRLITGQLQMLKGNITLIR